MNSNRPKIVGLSATIVISALVASPRAHGADEQLPLADEINQRFSDDADVSKDELKLHFDFALSFSRAIATHSTMHCRTSTPTGLTRTLREEQMLSEVAAAERDVVEHLTVSDQEARARLSPRKWVIYGMNSDAVERPALPWDRVPVTPPKSSKSDVLVDVESTYVAVMGVAMRFRDEERFVSGVTYAR